MADTIWRGFSYYSVILAFCFASHLVESNAYANDYRWKMIGDQGEEFVVTLLGTVPLENPPGSFVDMYTVDSADLQWSAPCDIPISVENPFSEPVVGRSENPPQIFVTIRPADRLDLRITLGRTLSPVPTLDQWATVSGGLFTFSIINTTNTAVISGNIVSVSSLPVPEPSAITLAVVGLLFTVRRHNRERS
ncbi:MAG: hypothetical protein R3E01_35145 [Pirellulaceae bacterium]